MSTLTYILAIIVMGIVALVLIRGLFNMMKGGDANLSNKLMQLRVLLQAIAVILIMLTLWLTGGGRPKHLNSGFYIEPTVFTDVEPSMKIFQEEIFGPVVSFIGYYDEADAVRKANNTVYGLHGAVYTADPERDFDMARRVRSGSLTVNGMIVDPKMPFGGFKQSGIGREGGVEGLELYFEPKTVYFG